jgi:carboxypeptidase PM20D1
MMIRWRRVTLAAALLCSLVVALAINVWRHPSLQLASTPVPVLSVDEQQLARQLSGAIQARTIAGPTGAGANADQFAALHRHLREAFPLLHGIAKVEQVGEHSLLYALQGSDAESKPIMLMAHQDVVPVSPGTETSWLRPPFGGDVADGFVWGRGAWDDKGNLVAQMHAVETLLAAGFRPRRTLYLAYGADEELGGARGAGAIARLLSARGVRLEFVLDEGLLISVNVIPGLDAPAAVIGVAEKGFVTIDLRVDVEPGHSSMPPTAVGHGAVVILGEALRRLDAHPMPARLEGPVKELFTVLAPEMALVPRFVLSNLWLFGPVVRHQLQRASSTNAMLRTTTALTVVRAGDAENVLPGSAQATLNFRIVPGDTIATVVEHVTRTIGDPRVSVAPRPVAAEPSPVSATSSASYRLVHRTLREVAPDVVVAPGLMVGGTDARYFQGISEQVFRFSPVRARAEDLPRLHGTNERLAVSDLAGMVRFYHRLIEQANLPPS